MAVPVTTFHHEGNRQFGATLFKALGHPKSATKAYGLIDTLRQGGPVIIVDPHNAAEVFDAYYGLSTCNIKEVYVQNVVDVGKKILGCKSLPLSDFRIEEGDSLFLATFDSQKLLEQLKGICPINVSTYSFDNIRLESSWLTNTNHYLDPLNFATNFALFRDLENLHTSLRSVNYWGGYNAENPELWLCLFDSDGKILAEWNENLPSANAGFEIDSQNIRKQFQLNEFCGSLFIHALRIKGHDIVKYALDIYGNDQTVLSTTHDANAWPADYYAGLPAPDKNEKVLLWIQNSHPMPIPDGAIGLNIMGSDQTKWVKDEIPAFATRAIETKSVLPDAQWPKQIEILAGRHFIRPRYEIIRNGRSRIAHVNVERSDLVPDSELQNLTKKLGKGFILPMPILPPDQYNTTLLPTPMARSQKNLPIAVIALDSEGKEIARQYLGKLPRDHKKLITVQELTAGKMNNYGHFELLYDFTGGGDADGWLHTIARFEDLVTQHISETSFGAHIYNTLDVYRDEPQSYAGPPPGLSTRLYLRIGHKLTKTFCHLIYPASKPWHAISDTHLILISNDGFEVATERINIPCGGSFLWNLDDIFEAKALKKAGINSYVLVRDRTCRLFGFHGLRSNKAFSLDHMFGF